MVVFAQESWDRYILDALPLWEEHYKELGASDMPWEPDLAMYEELVQANMLCIVSAREHSQLIGYMLAIVRRHPHYAALCAFEDSYYLLPAFREGKGLSIRSHTGVKLIVESLRILQNLGVQKAFFWSNQKHPTDVLFRHLGFKMTHSAWARNLGDL
jgi:hypothetical protein